MAAGRRSHGGGTQPFAPMSEDELADVAAFISSSGAAQYALQGLVTDSQNSPVSAVRITVASRYLPWDTTETVTDENGYFLFTNLNAGDYQVQASSPPHLFSPATAQAILDHYVDPTLDATDLLEFRMYQPGEIEPPPPRMVQRVSLQGDDANDGRSWETAKLSIAEALRQLPEGGEVWIAEGQYEEVLFVEAKSLYGGFAGHEMVRSQRNPDAHPTILDGSPAILSSLGIPSDSILILEGYDFYVSVIDGLILQNAEGFTGGAIDVGYHATAEIRHCLLASNAASEGGGAIHVSANARAVIDSNIIRENRASYGGALDVQPGGLVEQFSNNVIQGNQASQGGAIFCDGTILDFSHNTLVHNACDSGAVVLYGLGRGHHWNNIFAFNTAGLEDQAGESTEHHNDFFANAFGDRFGLEPDPSDLTLDPVFVSDATSDWHLSPLSPCIDAGSATTLLTDGEGRGRQQWSAPDLGAYEYPEPLLQVSLTAKDPTIRVEWQSSDSQISLESESDLHKQTWSVVGDIHVKEALHWAEIRAGAHAGFFRLRRTGL